MSLYDSIIAKYLLVKILPVGVMVHARGKYSYYSIFMNLAIAAIMHA